MIRSPGWLIALTLLMGWAVSGRSDARETDRQVPVGASPQDERAISEAKAKTEAAKARLASGARFEAGESLLLEIPVRWIPPGRFLMGSPSSDRERDEDEVQHEVVLSHGFFMAETECTQAQWQSVMGRNTAKFKGADRPVERVNWLQATEFCQKLTSKQRQEGLLPEGWEWRLPTEAEWEYAARAGTTGTRYGKLDLIGWYVWNAEGQTHAVKGKVSNAWGLYDMIGNVWEWCADWHGKYPTGSVTDPTGPSSGSYRVFRGGAWNLVADGARSAVRDRSFPRYSETFLGFRPALSSVR